MGVPDGEGGALDSEARRAFFDREEDAIAFGQKYPDWRVYLRKDGFDVPLVTGAQPATVPGPRPILIVEWQQTDGGGTIGFLAPSEELARGLAGEFGELKGPLGDTGFLGKQLFELHVGPLYDFEDVLHYLCRLAGPGGILTTW